MSVSELHLPDHQKGLLLTTLGVVVLTPDSLLVRLAGMEPFSLLVWRGVLQAIGILAILAVLHRGGILAQIRSIGRCGILLAVVFTGSTLFFILALSHTTVADVLIIIAVAPLVAALLSRSFLGEAVPLRTWLAIASTLLGIGLLVSEDLGSGSLWGDFAALCCAICIGASLTITRHGRAVSMIPAMSLAGVLTALAALPLALWLEPGNMMPAGSHLLAVLLMGLVVAPVSFALITAGPRYLPAAEVGLLMLLETVLGPLWVWLVIGEYPGNLAIAGGAIVIATLAGHALAGNRRRRAALP
ncbi:DMT family transporter [Pelagibius sp. CAU 1746]|uniref:DMT family transporter n=1 Tax=Pelagibius sp. CAU 1746 TaxID=3140370 RepID=UPI00325C2BC5